VPEAVGRHGELQRHMHVAVATGEDRVPAEQHLVHHAGLRDGRQVVVHDQPLAVGAIMSRNITLEQAENIIEACKAEARTVGQPMNIAVVDDGGNLVGFVAMDDTKLIGEDIAQKKALTAVYFQMDTRDLVPLVQPGAALYGIESTTGGRLVVFAGGVLLRRPDGVVAGGVGVSAGTVDEDHQVAEAGRQAFTG
jgi:uncharacterized protein GlcG (DUF336 family)